MQGHERYEELCALAAIAQMTDTEAEELREHLQGCDGCRNLQGDFTLILDQLPSVVEPQISNTGDVLAKVRREQFIRRAANEGISFSSGAVRGSTRGGWWRQEHWSFLIPVTVAVVMAVLVPLVMLFFSSRNPEKISNRNQISVPRAIKAEATPPIVPVEPKPALVKRQSDEQWEGKIAELEREDEALRAELSQKNAELAGAREQVKEISRTVSEESNALELAKSHIAEMDSAQREMIASITEKQTRIDDLRNELLNHDLAAERERQLNGAAKDVREMMAARNLHIIDVADVDGRGKARKAFGRVFYVEGQSLVFYAFDLGEIASPSKVLFQAWGQHEGVDGKPRNLGVFRIDDQLQKRWVLRVNDANALASIDSLFVTVEPSPGTNEPTGRRLIYAYLGTPANHP